MNSPVLSTAPVTVAAPNTAGDHTPAITEPAVPTASSRRPVLVYLTAGWLILIALAAILAPILPIASYEIPVGRPRSLPSLESLDMLLGTDTLGRSILSRIIYGAQVSLIVGAVATIAGFTIGSFFGLMAGFFKKRTDAITGLLTDAMLAFPPLILLLALSSVLTPSLRTILLGLSIVAIPSFIRLSRANTMAWSSREFVRASRNMGAGNWRILFREVTPNVLPPLTSYLPIVMAALIVAEGSLSFLGLGIPPPTPSWGGMINDGKDAISEFPALVMIPSLAIFFTVFSLNQLGDFAREKFDRTITK